MVEERYGSLTSGAPDYKQQSSFLRSVRSCAHIASAAGRPSLPSSATTSRRATQLELPSASSRRRMVGFGAYGLGAHRREYLQLRGIERGLLQDRAGCGLIRD